jgi:hypothetical protein
VVRERERVSEREHNQNASNPTKYVGHAAAWTSISTDADQQKPHLVSADLCLHCWPLLLTAPHSSPFSSLHPPTHPNRPLLDAARRMTKRTTLNRRRSASQPGPRFYSVSFVMLLCLPELPDPSSCRAAVNTLQGVVLCGVEGKHSC